MLNCRKLAWGWLLVLLAGAAQPLRAQLPTPPKREMRAVWVAHVFNLDWPSRKTLTPEQQRQEFTSLVDRHRQLGANAVVVQVRSAADAVYPSTLAPWSEWLTGTQGQAPSPLYDPLEFMVRTTHRRGLEFHAWLNPYRALTNATAANVAPTHVTRQHPEWIVSYGTLRILNPGLPEVRRHLTQVVLEVVRNYDVDAIHFDDYFYPAPQAGLTFDDDAAFTQDPRGFTSKADWRRNNIDLFVQMVSDSIRRVKPWVKFGISPPGVWRNGVSVGGTATTAFQSYTDIFADSRKWLQQGWVDYLAPQVYFGIGQAAANYSLIVPWWNQQVLPTVPRHVYIGLGAYRVSATATEVSFRSPSQLPQQLRLLRAQPNVQGAIFYKSTDLLNNPLGLADSLRQNFYRTPALRPTMPWKDNVPPLAPTALAVRPGSAAGTTVVSWTAPPPATDGGTARQYVVYRLPFRTTPATAADLTDPTTIVAITDSTAYVEAASSGGPRTYVVTALDRLHNESAPAQLNFTVTGTRSALAARLEPAAPNPFRQETRLTFHLPTAGPATLRAYDLTGREVAVLATGTRPAGPHTVVWRAGSLPAGLYVLVLQTPAGILRQRVVLAR
ncbi:family 10 glycosylhydrolase [Hymenobacter weizhouensis]|uniref:family 10 glycosylhydrolase n=1 Tax=Hymenobacter sp. YIM 151500-1 TaxID=2987689 RepID=UPI002226401C|nr:family 10 glycosylhydrolase [Hymenobacter sp. YIM 151500-1]UYZ62255.1 family 10 glycosylhydrolase [Hymenobacter sp. YIM 151500-1]